MLVYFPALHYSKNLNKNSSAVAVEEFLQGDFKGTILRVVGQKWRGLEPRDNVLTTYKAINTHASQRFIQEDLRYCS